jgi:hypothetical protein
MSNGWTYDVVLAADATRVVAFVTGDPCWTWASIECLCPGFRTIWKAVEIEIAQKISDSFMQEIV